MQNYDRSNQIQNQTSAYFIKSSHIQMRTKASELQCLTCLGISSLDFPRYFKSKKKKKTSDIRMRCVCAPAIIVKKTGTIHIPNIPALLSNICRMSYVSRSLLPIQRKSFFIICRIAEWSPVCELLDRRPYTDSLWWWGGGGGVSGFVYKISHIYR